jgi:probable F420-dependent oxidoreductase
VKFWQATSWVETEQLVDIARFAEEVGFHGIFNSDHAFFPEQYTQQYPGSKNGEMPMRSHWPYPDCWVTIAAMAAATSRIEFSTAVYILPLRSPFEVAKATSTLAITSNNRFALGIGVGWLKEEFDICGVDFHSRGKRTDEMIEILHKFWRGGIVSHQGRFFNFPAVQMEPHPPKPIPIYVGGKSPAALRRAAWLGDGWIGNGQSIDEVRDILAKLNDMRREAGRSHLPFETIIPLTTVPNVDTFRLLQQQGMTASFSMPFTLELGLTSTLDQKKRVMEKFARDIIHKMRD